MRIRHLQFALPIFAVCVAGIACSPRAFGQAASQAQGPVKITLDDAIQMALAHNHTLLAARTTIQQSEAAESSANVRPNPVLVGDAQFLPIFNTNQFDSTYLDNSP